MYSCRLVLVLNSRSNKLHQETARTQVRGSLQKQKYCRNNSALDLVDSMEVGRGSKKNSNVVVSGVCAIWMSRVSLRMGYVTNLVSRVRRRKWRWEKQSAASVEKTSKSSIDTFCFQTSARVRETLFCSFLLQGPCPRMMEGWNMLTGDNRGFPGIQAMIEVSLGGWGKFRDWGER